MEGLGWLIPLFFLGCIFLLTIVKQRMHSKTIVAIVPSGTRTHWSAYSYPVPVTNIQPPRVIRVGYTGVATGGF